MKNTTLKIFSSIDKLANHSADYLIKKINNDQINDTFSIAVSGGNTPKYIFNFIAKEYKNKIRGERVKLFFGDERCVPPDSNESNFRMVNENLIRKINIPESNVFRINGEADPIKEAQRYGKLIEQNIPKKNNIPQFDLIMLGLGEDGHIASIFPNQLSNFYSKNNCEAAIHPVTKQKRITITGEVINNAKQIVFFVIGENKSQIVSEIFTCKSSKKIYPASLVAPKNGELVWMLDTNAVQLLDSQIKQAGIIQ